MITRATLAVEADRLDADLDVGEGLALRLGQPPVRVVAATPGTRSLISRRSSSSSTLNDVVGLPPESAPDRSARKVEPFLISVGTPVTSMASPAHSG